MHLYPERCSGLYSYWGFAPSLLVTSSAQYLVLCSCYGFAPSLLKCKLPKLFAASPRPFLVISATHYLGRCSCYGFTSPCSNINSQKYLQLRPSLPIIVAVAQCHVAVIIFNRVHCVSAKTDDCILASTNYCILAKTGWKPKKNIAQSNALGIVDHLFCALKEQKELGSVPTTNDFIDVWVLFSFCAYSAPVCFYIHTQSVALGCIPVGASPRPCL